MKLFISWSGETSHKVALALKEWIPLLLQSVEPYVSSEDIDKGKMWAPAIAGELSESQYGIVCLTSKNLTAPWINFEAGALSKQVDQANVSPFLVDLRKSDVLNSSPLSIFQLTSNEREDFRKLLRSINGATKSPLADSTLTTLFDKWWPDLERDLNDIVRESQETLQVDASGELPPFDITKIGEIVEEILGLTRAQTTLIKNPADLLPVNYLSKILKDNIDLNTILINKNTNDENKYRRGNIFQMFQTVDYTMSQIKQNILFFNRDIKELIEEDYQANVETLLTSFNTLTEFISKLKTYM